MIAPEGSFIDVFPYEPIRGYTYGLKIKGKLYVCPFLYESLKDPDTFLQVIRQMKFMDMDEIENSL